MSNNDIVKLQELSLSPGGFGSRRKDVWCPLFEESTLLTSSFQFLRDDLSPHPDEHQVQLDTNRSFVLYPAVDGSTAQKKVLQKDLHDIILGVLRKRPSLRYFQGYHDIITVLFLTLPPELVLPCAEKLSLHRLRDSMGKGLEPLVGQLRILKRLLRITDPPYAATLEKNASLPYYALSNLLTLFSHDIPTLSLIQQVFDWVLCRPPVASVWLAAAVILCKKDEVLALEREGEEAMGMAHAVLSALPPLSDEHHFSDSPPLVHGTPMSEPNLGINEDGSSEPMLSRTDLAEDSLAEVPASPSMDKPACLTRSQSDLGSHSGSESQSLPGEYKEKEAKSPIPLFELLKLADDLLADYPPSSPALRLTETLGLQSALRTSGTILFSLNDNEAEACVGGDDVVLPPNQEELDEELGNMKEEKQSELQHNRRREKRARKQRIVVRTQAVVAGTVLLLGVAVALYGLNPNAKGKFNCISGAEDVKLVVAWVGAILGMGERLGVGL
ncbi:rab-GTPase-TBC domain-containing protein [Hysterangium stoloniferum]|nr:rab-GTPase-TBC domain-containing protein [Hysterangium stoloniferum]